MSWMLIASIMSGGILIGCGEADRVPRSDLSATHAEIWRGHAKAESQSPAIYTKLATGLPIRGKRSPYPWPVELVSIGHTIASYQNYGGSPYFHHGIDIRADAGSDVLASAGGRVVNVENYMGGNPAYWEVAILDDEGYLWQYHHVERNSIPQAVWSAFRSGGRIDGGTKIGEVYYWGSTAFGERFHHIHLNILGAESRYLNPFAFLEPLPDSNAPAILDVGLLQNSQGSNVGGPYSIYAKVHDLIMHDRFVVPAYLVTYAVDGGAPVTAWQFDQLPGGPSNSRYVEDYFVRSLTCGNYDCRQLSIDLAFSPNGDRTFPMLAGRHSVEIVARDFAGNETSATFQWNVSDER